MRSSSGIGSVPLPPASDEDAPSTTWHRLYRPDGDPEEGGFGSVHPVIHLLSGDRRALKQPLHYDNEHRARFRREIQVQRSVEHTNVMPILDADAENEWFVMPWANRTFFASAPEMCDEELAAVFHAIARGLHAAHTKGFVHRDVKPNNVLELHGETGARWVVSDFGLVRRPKGTTTGFKTQRALGTEGFMAPEVALGGHDQLITPRADIYGLGATIAWATTGRYPRTFEPAEGRGPWTQLALRMTQFEPDQRPESMLEVIESIREIERVAREARRAGWGKSVSSSVTESDEVVLSAVFEHSWDPDRDDDEIAVTIIRLSELFPGRASLRISIRRLTEAGFLREGWYQHGNDAPTRTYSPTDLGWAWAKENESRLPALRAVYEPSRPVSAVPPSGIPF